MQEFDDLVSVAKTLLGPQGCSWDHKQTFFSLQPYLLEEMHELLDAVDRKDDCEIVEEIGDVFYVLLFYATLGEKEGRFSLQEILTQVRDKMIRRHPHVFSSLSVADDEEIVKNWESIKKEEKKERKSALEGIPSQLPLLAKAQKLQKIFCKKGFSVEPHLQDDLAAKLWYLIHQAAEQGEELESLFRRRLLFLQEAFAAQENL